MALKFLEEKKFLAVCPNCQSINKVVKKCHSCKNWCCSSCSVNNECIGCYTESVEHIVYVENISKNINESVRKESEKLRVLMEEYPCG